MTIDVDNMPFGLYELTEDDEGNTSKLLIALYKDYDKAIATRNYWNYKLKQEHNYSKQYILYDYLDGKQIR